MARYEAEFNIKSNDKSGRFFTREEQIDIYARNLEFWEKNLMSSGEVFGPRFMYIGMKKREFENTMKEYFKDEPETIREIYARYNELLRNTS